MGKIKNRAEAKQLSGKSAHEKFWLARLGNISFNYEVINAALALSDGVSDSSSGGIFFQILQRHRQEFERGDVSFLREIFAVFDRLSSPPPDIRFLAVAQLVIIGEFHRDPPWTKPEIMRRCRETGIKISIQQIERYLKYLDYHPAKGAPGRPGKKFTKQKSGESGYGVRYYKGRFHVVKS